MSGKKLVYTLFTDEAHRDEYARPMVVEFLKANGLDPMRAVVGNPVEVFRHDDGTLRLETWQTVEPGEGEERWPLCESCPSCVKQERVSVLLAAPVPDVIGAHLYDDLDKVGPADPVAAAESAYRTALADAHQSAMNHGRTVERRADLLAKVRNEPGSIHRRMVSLGLLSEPDAEVTA